MAAVVIEQEPHLMQLIQLQASEDDSHKSDLQVTLDMVLHKTWSRPTDFTGRLFE